MKLSPEKIKGTIVVRDSATNTIQPMVCLSVEEAKEIFNELSKLDTYTGLKTLVDSEDGMLKVSTRTQTMLKERIAMAMRILRSEQAEVEDETK